MFTMSYHRTLFIVMGALLFITSAAYVYAWDAPTATPPNNNALPPLNEGTTTQAKQGTLGAKAFAVYGTSPRYIGFTSSITGYTPSDTGYGIRDNNGTLEFKASGQSWSQLQITSAGFVGVNSSTAPAARFVVGAAGSANNVYYDIGTDKIAAGTSIYSYGAVCAGNSSGNCTGTGGVVMKSDGNVFAAGYFHTSDATLKENIATAPGLATVLRLRGVTFDWKKTHEHSAGVVAQEVEKVLPYAVATAGTVKTVEYDQLTAYLIEAVKEQQAEIKSLQDEVAQLKAHHSL